MKQADITLKLGEMNKIYKYYKLSYKSPKICDTVPFTISINNFPLVKQADITLKLGEMAPPKQSALKNLYITKPPISHKFREAEERPPAIVSQAFTVACILPLVGLLVAVS